ncbi:MAG: class I SAM-dependent methyltransferase, partial [Kiritimatiellae bacterium]|nr:class I SAM-dependent methyltransferase [Kiritimatiellia bacterium]
IIVDYPTSQSLNKIAPMLFKAKKKFEGDTRTWKLFKHAEVIDEFKKNGYIVERKKAQFFLPMVLHRALKLPILSIVSEGICRALGLTHFWGSPMIVKMVPK